MKGRRKRKSKEVFQTIMGAFTTGFLSDGGVMQDILGLLEKYFLVKVNKLYKEGLKR